MLNSLRKFSLITSISSVSFTKCLVINVFWSGHFLFFPQIVSAFSCTERVSTHLCFNDVAASEHYRYFCIWLQTELVSLCGLDVCVGGLCVCESARKCAGRAQLSTLVLQGVTIQQKMLQMVVRSLQAITILLLFLCHMHTQSTVWWIMVAGSWWVFSWQPAVPADSLAVSDNLWTLMELRSCQALRQQLINRRFISPC